MKKLTVGQQLHSFLDTNNLKQRQLSTMLNVPKETLNRWINDVRKPSKYYSRLLEKELKIFIDRRQS